MTDTERRPLLAETQNGSDTPRALPSYTNSEETEGNVERTTHSSPPSEDASGKPPVRMVTIVRDTFDRTSSHALSAVIERPCHA